MQCCPDVLINPNALVCAPKESAAEKAGQEEDTVVPLGSRSGHVQLIEEPVEIQEGRGELVEDKCWAVEVDKWSLPYLSVQTLPMMPIRPP